MPTKVGNYDLVAELGHGSYANVYKGIHVKSGHRFAIKAISKDRINDKRLRENLNTEIAIVRDIQHPNIVGLYDNFENSRYIFLVLELCRGGDLSTYIKKYRRLNEKIAQHFLRQLSDGLSFLYEKNIIHRDLKPANVLLSEPNEYATLKLADFGFAKHLAEASLAQTQCGSPLYMAPEILENHEYDSRADIWSIGCIFYEMLVGHTPFTGTNQRHLLTNILTKSLAIPSDVTVDTLSMTLLQKMLKVRQADRVDLPSFSQLCQNLPRLIKPTSETAPVQTSSTTPPTPLSAGKSGAIPIYNTNTYANTTTSTNPYTTPVKSSPYSLTPTNIDLNIQEQYYQQQLHHQHMMFLQQQQQPYIASSPHQLSSSPYFPMGTSPPLTSLLPPSAGGYDTRASPHNAMKSNLNPTTMTTLLSLNKTYNMPSSRVMSGGGVSPNTPSYNSHGGPISNPSLSSTPMNTPHMTGGPGGLVTPGNNPYMVSVPSSRSSSTDHSPSQTPYTTGVSPQHMTGNSPYFSYMRDPMTTAATASTTVNSTITAPPILSFEQILVISDVDTILPSKSMPPASVRNDKYNSGQSLSPRPTSQKLPELQSTDPLQSLNSGSISQPISNNSNFINTQYHNISSHIPIDLSSVVVNNMIQKQSSPDINLQSQPLATSKLSNASSNNSLNEDDFVIIESGNHPYRGGIAAMSIIEKNKLTSSSMPIKATTATTTNSTYPMSKVTEPSKEQESTSYPYFQSTPPFTSMYNTTLPLPLPSTTQYINETDSLNVDPILAVTTTTTSHTPHTGSQASKGYLPHNMLSSTHLTQSQHSNEDNDNNKTHIMTSTFNAQDVGMYGVSFSPDFTKHDLVESTGHSISNSNILNTQTNDSFQTHALLHRQLQLDETVRSDKNHSETSNLNQNIHTCIPTTYSHEPSNNFYLLEKENIIQGGVDLNPIENVNSDDPNVVVGNTVTVENMTNRNEVVYDPITLNVPSHVLDDKIIQLTSQYNTMKDMVSLLVEIGDDVLRQIFAQPNDSIPLNEGTNIPNISLLNVEKLIHLSLEDRKKYIGQVVYDSSHLYIYALSKLSDMITVVDDYIKEYHHETSVDGHSNVVDTPVTAGSHDNIAANSSTNATHQNENDDTTNTNKFESNTITNSQPQFTHKNTDITTVTILSCMKKELFISFQEIFQRIEHSQIYLQVLSNMDSTTTTTTNTATTNIITNTGDTSTNSIATKIIHEKSLTQIMYESATYLCIVISSLEKVNNYEKSSSYYPKVLYLLENVMSTLTDIDDELKLNKFLNTFEIQHDHCKKYLSRSMSQYNTNSTNDPIHTSI